MHVNQRGTAKGCYVATVQEVAARAQLTEDGRRTFGAVMHFMPRFDDPKSNRIFGNLLRQYDKTEIGTTTKVLEVYLRKLTTGRRAVGDKNSEYAGLVRVLRTILTYIDVWRTEARSMPLGIGRDPRKMTLEELLTLLFEQPRRYPWLYRVLLNHTAIRITEEVTLCWVELENSKPSVERTLRRVHLIASRYSSHNPPYGNPGMNLTTIEDALGYRERALVHPLSGLAVSGRTKDNLHFGGLWKMVATAIRWATINKHPGLPIDMLANNPELLFTDPHADSWLKDILFDYTFAASLHPGKVHETRFHRTALLPSQSAYPAPLI